METWKKTRPDFELVNGLLLYEMMVGNKIPLWSDYKIAVEISSGISNPYLSH